MDSLGMSGHGSLLESLGQGRMGMASSGNVLSRGAILESERTLGNHFAGVGANDVNTKQTISLGVGNHLDQTLGVHVGLGTRVGTEGKGTNPVRDLLCLQVLLGLADPSDLGIGIHDRGNAAIVDVPVALLDVFDDSDSFLLGLVRQHGTKGSVTYTTDVGDLGAVLGVDDDTATLVEFHANVLETKVTGVWAAANGYQDNFSIQLYVY